MSIASYESGGRVCVLGYEPSVFGPLPFAAQSTFAGDIDGALKKAERSVNKQLIERAAEDLVVRSRARDQNAIAILTLIGQNAARGVPRAIETLRAVQAYTAAHPYRQFVFGSDAPPAPPPNTRFVREAVGHLSSREPARRQAAEVMLPEVCRANQDAAVLVLWRGALLDSARIKRLMAALEPADRKAFARGARRPERVSASPAELYGAAVSKARRIQLFSEPNSKAGVLGSSIGWELD